jgi:hypothetical protein
MHHVFNVPREMPFVRAHASRVRGSSGRPKTVITRRHHRRAACGTCRAPWCCRRTCSATETCCVEETMLDILSPRSRDTMLLTFRPEPANCVPKRRSGNRERPARTRDNCVCDRIELHGNPAELIASFLAALTLSRGSVGRPGHVSKRIQIEPRPYRNRTVDLADRGLKLACTHRTRVLRRCDRRPPDVASEVRASVSRRQ